MQQFSLVYNNLFVFLEPVDEPQPTYACGQLMQGTAWRHIMAHASNWHKTEVKIFNNNDSLSPTLVHFIRIQQ